MGVRCMESKVGMSYCGVCDRYVIVDAVLWVEPLIRRHLTAC